MFYGELNTRPASVKTKRAAKLLLFHLLHKLRMLPHVYQWPAFLPSASGYNIFKKVLRHKFSKDGMENQGIKEKKRGLHIGRRSLEIPSKSEL
jgi:hypothetical protein